jgi:hypothetical protein
LGLLLPREEFSIHLSEGSEAMEKWNGEEIKCKSFAAKATAKVYLKYWKYD